MKIDFTNEQYRKLLLLVHLGDWMINVHREDGLDEESQDIMHHLLVSHKEFDVADLVDARMDEGKYFESRKMDDWAHTFIENYDDETFWDELSHRLVDRDFYLKYTEAQIKKMDRFELIDIQEDMAGSYQEEFCQNGLDNVVIRQSTKTAENHPFKARDE